MQRIRRQPSTGRTRTARRARRTLGAVTGLALLVAGLGMSAGSALGGESGASTRASVEVSAAITLSGLEHSFDGSDTAHVTMKVETNHLAGSRVAVEAPDDPTGASEPGSAARLAAAPVPTRLAATAGGETVTNALRLGAASAERGTNSLRLDYVATVE